MCGKVKYTVTALILLTSLKTAKRRNSHGGAPPTASSHSSQIITNNTNTKDSLSVFYPSLNLLDLYYRPVLHVAVPV